MVLIGKAAKFVINQYYVPKGKSKKSCKAIGKELIFLKIFIIVKTHQKIVIKKENTNVFLGTMVHYANRVTIKIIIQGKILTHVNLVSIHQIPNSLYFVYSFSYQVSILFTNIIVRKIRIIL